MTTAVKNPLETLSEDWKAAKQQNDPNAPFCTLITIDHETGFPTGRVVTIREIDPSSGSILVFVNSTSPKWKQLLASSKYEVLIFWPAGSMVQYRLRGDTWETLDEHDMKQRWMQNKPHSSKLHDYYYNQGQSQSSGCDRQKFLDGMKRLQQEFDGKEIPFPTDVKGLVLQPTVVEEWRGSVKDRLHERYLHEKSSGHDGKDCYWQKKALVP